TVIPNWVDTEAIKPAPKDNPWSRENGFADGFVVMHSGNVGHAQNLDALVRATTFLRDLDDLVVAEERRRAHERIEVLRMADVAGVHDDEAVGEPVLPGPGVVLGRGLDRLRVDPVRNDG